MSVSDSVGLSTDRDIVIGEYEASQLGVRRAPLPGLLRCVPPKASQQGKHQKIAMPVRPILSFPDPRLRLTAAPVLRFDADLRALADDLLETMRDAPGIGITAPHIGVLSRLVVLELAPGDVRIYVNPELDQVSRETIRHTEGSVSMPGVTDELERHARVRVPIRTSTGRNGARRRTACSRSAISTRSTSSTASSGSTACPASSAIG
nr:peptide deformylase [Sphingopyxis sp. UBA6723]